MPEPSCAKHPDADHPDRKVVKAGTNAIGDHPRQMFWCYPDGTRADPDRHRYGGALARAVLQPSDPTFCADCSTDLEFHEGPIHAQRYDFPTRAIAAAMVAVGAGTSYNEAARNVRATFDRQSKSSRSRAIKGANGTLVADWVGAHGPALSAPVTADVSWPRVIALDELPFVGSKARRRAAAALGRPKGSVGWCVLGAYAYPDLTTPSPTRVPKRGAGAASARDRRRGYLLALAPASEINGVEEAKFLRSFPGRPDFVLFDGGKVWPLAVRLAWPDVWDVTTGELLEAAPRMLPCIWHLGGDLRLWLKSTLVATEPDPTLTTPPPHAGPSCNVGLVNKTTRARCPDYPTPGRVRLMDGHPLHKAAAAALKNLGAWDAFYALAQEWRADELLARLGDGSDVREMLITWPPGVSRSTGGLEADLDKVKRHLRYRSATLANVERTQQMLNLMLMSLRGLADERAYNRVLHDSLLPADGRPTPQKVGITGGARLQGVPTERNAYQFPKLGPATPYERRRAVRQTPAGRRRAAALAAAKGTETEGTAVPP